MNNTDYIPPDEHLGSRFYVSRKLTRDKVFVMDTQDGVEELFTIKDLKDIALKHNIHIEGLNILYSKSGIPRSAYCTPYYDRADKQVLLESVAHLITKSQNGYLISIKGVRGYDSTNNIKIVLSEYFRGILPNALTNTHARWVTLVIDNKLEVQSGSLGKKSSVYIDLTRLTDDRIASKFYSAVLEYRYIIDIEERKRKILLKRNMDYPSLQSCGLPQDFIQEKLDLYAKEILEYITLIKTKQFNYTAGMYTAIPIYYLTNILTLWDFFDLDKRYNGFIHSLFMYNSPHLVTLFKALRLSLASNTTLPRVYRKTLSK